VSRKHYIAIATTLNYSQKLFASEEAFEQFCKNMGYTLKMFNDRFNMDRFMEACKAVRRPIEQRNLTF